MSSTLGEQGAYNLVGTPEEVEEALASLRRLEKAIVETFTDEDATSPE